MTVISVLEAEQHGDTRYGNEQRWEYEEACRQRVDPYGKEVHVLSVTEESYQLEKDLARVQFATVACAANPGMLTMEYGGPEILAFNKAQACFVRDQLPFFEMRDSIQRNLLQSAKVEASLAYDAALAEEDLIRAQLRPSWWHSYSQRPGHQPSMHLADRLLRAYPGILKRGSERALHVYRRVSHDDLVVEYRKSLKLVSCLT